MTAETHHHERRLRRIKRWVRSALKEVDVWLEDEPHGGFAYHELNPLLRRLMREYGRDLRASYTWGAIHATHLAKQLGRTNVALLEFGVAGGRGLLALDSLVPHLERAFGIAVEVYGFDTGVGLPTPVDHRDLPNLWNAGYFPMQRDELVRRLRRAKLVLGDIGETLPEFLRSPAAPAGFVSIDVDLYSSTAQALKLLEAESERLLPRVYYYFDDIQGFTFADCNGERLAIAEFNESHAMRKLSPLYGLRHFVPREMRDEQWVELFFLAHIMDHPDYGRNDGLLRRQRLDI